MKDRLGNSEGSKEGNGMREEVTYRDAPKLTKETGNIVLKTIYLAAVCARARTN